MRPSSTHVNRIRRIAWLLLLSGSPATVAAGAAIGRLHPAPSVSSHPEPFGRVIWPQDEMRGIRYPSALGFRSPRTGQPGAPRGSCRGADRGVVHGRTVL